MDHLSPRLYELLLAGCLIVIWYFVQNAHAAAKKHYEDLTQQITTGLGGLKDAIHDLHLTLINEFVDNETLKEKLEELEEKLIGKIALCAATHAGRKHGDI
jgi:hypothetical protein